MSEDLLDGAREAQDACDRPHDEAAATRALFERLEATTDPDERDRLRSAVADLNMPIARHIARRYRGRGEPIEEIEQAAYVGLVKAINGFRPERGDFAPYAVATISGEIKRHFRDRCWAIRPTRRVQELKSQCSRAAADLSQRLGRDPSPLELAAELGTDEAAIAEADQARVCYSLASLDDDAGNSGGWLADNEPGFRSAEARDMLARALAELSDRERRIVGMRFYLGLTQREIAAEFGTTQMQISRTLTRVFGRLRDAIGDAAA